MQSKFVPRSVTTAPLFGITLDFPVTDLCDLRIEYRITVFGWGLQVEQNACILSLRENKPHKASAVSGGKFGLYVVVFQHNTVVAGLGHFFFMAESRTISCVGIIFTTRFGLQ